MSHQYRYYIQHAPLSVRRYTDDHKERWDRKTQKWSEDCANEETCARDRLVEEPEALQVVTQLSVVK